MKARYGAMLLTVTVIAIGLYGSRTLAGIAGSKHDFSGATWSKNQMCLPCHTPHNATLKDAQGNMLDAPLWNHAISTATYTLYLNSSGTKVTGPIDQNSRLCLSCHDGTVALDSFGGTTGSTMISNPKSNFGTDLSDDHPMGDHAIWTTPTPVKYVDQTLRDNAGIMPLVKMADGRLAVGCASCHEPHNAASTNHMLWVSNDSPITTVDGRSVAGSGLCLNCHKK